MILRTCCGFRFMFNSALRRPPALRVQDAFKAIKVSEADHCNRGDVVLKFQYVFGHYLVDATRTTRPFGIRRTQYEMDGT